MDASGGDAHMSRMGQHPSEAPGRQGPPQRPARHIPMHAVRSSSIAAVGYDPRRRTLRIRFIGGDSYDYLHVSPKVFGQLLDAPSKGRFVNWQVKPHFPYRRVT
jgi:KTSC domain